MADTIKGAGDIYEKDLYKNISKSGLDFIDVLNEMNKLFEVQAELIKNSVSANIKDAKSIDQVGNAFESSNKSYEKRIKIDTERTILQQKINDQIKIESKSLESLQANVDSLRKQRASLNKAEKNGVTTALEANKQRAELNVLIKVSNKRLNDAQKEVIDLTNVNKKLDGEYDKQSKRLNELRKEFKDLILTEKKSTKETRKLQKEISKLDKELKDVDASAGQFQRNVGNYPETLQNATKAILATTAAAVGLKGGFDGIETSLNSTTEGSEEVRKVTSGLGGVFDQVKNVTASFALDLFDAGKAIVDVATGAKTGRQALGAFASVFKRTGDATEDFGKKVSDSVNANIELAESTIQFEKDIRPLEQRLSVLNGLIEQQAIIAGDSTRSFDDLNKAVVRGQALQEQRAKINIDIAKQELLLIQEEIRTKNLSVDASKDLLDQETQAIIKLADAENDLRNERAESRKEGRQIKQDELERDLDILIDGFDNQKTINERIIDNDKETLDARSQILEETRKLSDESFNAQKDVLADLSNAGIDVDELLSLDATELQKRIRQLEQSEIIEGRTLEVVRERRTVLQDLSDSQDELNDAQQEGLDLQADIIAQEEALGKVTEESEDQTRLALENLDKDREQNQIDSLRRRLENSKEGSIEALNLEKELNDALLDQQTKFLDEQEDKEKESLERRRQIQGAILDSVSKSIQDNSSKNIESINEEIEATQNQQERLRELANEGVLGADRSLASEEKKEAELKREAEREEIKQKRLSAAFDILSALLESGASPQEALSQSGVLVAALPEIINALPTFYEGTKTTVADALGAPNLNTSKDGYAVRVDGSEKILNPSQSARTGNKTTEEITGIVESHDNGMFNDLYKYNQPNIDKVIDSGWYNNDQILSRFESLESSLIQANSKIEKAINNKPVFTGAEFVKATGHIITMEKEGNRLKRTKQKFRAL